MEVSVSSMESIRNRGASIGLVVKARRLSAAAPWFSDQTDMPAAPSPVHLPWFLLLSHPISRRTLRTLRAQAMADWNAATTVA